jgi:hypothetical protein
MPRSPKGRAAARGLDARLNLQHPFMPAGDASLKTSSGQSKCWLTVITVSTANISHGNCCDQPASECGRWRAQLGLDPEAERLIADGLRRAPHAVYALVQTALLHCTLLFDDRLLPILRVTRF